MTNNLVSQVANQSVSIRLTGPCDPGGMLDAQAVAAGVVTAWVKVGSVGRVRSVLDGLCDALALVGPHGFQRVGQVDDEPFAHGWVGDAPGLLPRPRDQFVRAGRVVVTAHYS